MVEKVPGGFSAAFNNKACFTHDIAQTLRLQLNDPEAGGKKAVARDTWKNFVAALQGQSKYAGPMDGMEIVVE